MPIVIFVTAKDKEEAEKISKGLLEKKLIACANIIDGVRSLFRWEGKIDDEGEVLLVLKSTEERLEEVVSTVKSLHSYEIPEVIAIPIVGGNPDYLEWVNKEVS